MKRILIAVSAMTLAVAGAYAQTTPPGAKRDAQNPSGVQPSGPPTSDRSEAMPSFKTLDKDNDGSVSKKEADASPSAKRDFSKLDKNNDGKLSSSEYAAHSSGSSSSSPRSGSGSGGTTTGPRSSTK